MAITCVGMTNGTGQTTSSASVATGSISPSANKLYLAVVVSRRSGSAPAAPTVSGCGINWVQVATRSDATNLRRITVFRGMEASGLTAGAVTAALGASMTVSLISVLELDGVDTTGVSGAGAIVTSAQNGATGSAASGSITMSAWADAVNGAAVSAWWHANAEVSNPDSGWTEVSDQAGISSTCLECQFRVGQDTAAAVTWGGGSAAWGGIAVEIKYAPVLVTYDDTPSGGIVLGGSVVQGKTYDDIESGGVVLNGSCSSALIPAGPVYTVTPSGGIALGGSSVSALDLVFGGGGTGGIDANTVLNLHLDTPWKQVSALGTAQVDTAQSKFGGGSALFDGSGARLTTPDSPDFEFGTGDFTIDFWIMLNSATGSRSVVSKRGPSSTEGWVFYQLNATLYMYAASASGAWDITDSNPFALGITPGTWHHVALTRQGTTWRGFWDGVQSFTFTNANAMQDNVSPLSVGASSNGSEAFNGWIEELRVSKGACRWTANFTPPAAPYTRDVSTTLLIHCDGPDGSQNFTDAEAGPDSSQSDHQIINAGYSPTLATSQSKFGGASLLLDPASVLSPDSADWDFGSGDFTVDLWWQPTTLVDCTIIGQTNSYAIGQNNAWAIGMSDYAKGVMFEYSTDGSNMIQLYTNGTFTPVVGTWYHLAAVRSGTSLKLYVNGVQSGPTYSINGTLFSSSEPLLIGSRTYDGQWNFARCYLDEIRISKGIARWTSNFTPPSAPYSTGGGGVGVSGGIVLNGSCSSSVSTGNVYNLTPSGGIVLGGTQTNTKAVSTTQTGGIVLGGSVSQTLIRAVTPSGGIVLGGSVAVTAAVTITVAPSGGIVLGGSVVTQIGGATSVSPIGGIVLGGSCVTARTFPAVPTGGIVLGGTCSTVRSVVITVAPSGGIVLGGSVVTTLIPPGPTYTLTPAGGLVLGGTCTSSLNLLVIYTSTPSGGIRLDGVVLVSQAAVIFPISDLSDGTWTDQVGGSNLWAAIDETSPSDADYIKSATAPVTADICQVEFPGTYDPQLSTGHALTYRYGSDQEGWTTVTQVLTGAQADAISDYNHLSVKFEAKA